ncbi:hypothetical protein EDD11_001199 [Mortierella claussenii]|nr:hypothetical protein EDD11_001199 [Mortierella claussenii]
MFTKITGRDQERSLKIVILSSFRGPGNLPAVYAVPEEPNYIRGYVEFNSSDELKGGDIDLTFRIKSRARWVRNYGQTVVVYSSKQDLQRKEWHFPVLHSDIGIISAGQKRFDFEVALDPQAPSSVVGRRGWLDYRFAATLHRSFPRRNIKFTQDVWVFRTCIPAPNPDWFPTPHVHTGIWETHLPFICTLSSKNVPLGATVPLTIQFEPFLSTSGHVGQELVVVRATVKLKEYTRLWSKRNVKHGKKKILVMDVNDGWPQAAREMQRTILVDIPNAPRLSCTTFTRPLQKTHVLKLIMQLKTSNMADNDAREFRVEMDVNVTAPRPPTDVSMEDLPPYSAVWLSDNDRDDSD